MTPDDLRQRITSTYFWLRGGMAVIAFLFPPLLYLRGVLGRGLPLQESMSAYYHAGNGYMRDWFVGLLFAIGIMLFIYKGFTRVEDYALNAAGVLALGIALYPTEWRGSGHPAHYGQIHGFCAVTFFLCIAYVCWFHANDTLDLLTQEGVRRRYQGLYRTQAVVMALAPIIAGFISGESRTFWMELIGIWTFSWFWVTKSLEIQQTKADAKAVRGELEEVAPPAETPLSENTPPPRVPSLVDELLGRCTIREKLGV